MPRASDVEDRYRSKRSREPDDCRKVGLYGSIHCLHQGSDDAFGRDTAMMLDAVRGLCGLESSLCVLVVLASEPER